ncbi:hypothetical protein M128_2032 [Bacteroides fragilis str. S6L8]|nr:hypothetical protein M128_2032 [Bacteroides fragilis str. S6L8]
MPWDTNCIRNSGISADKTGYAGKTIMRALKPDSTAVQPPGSGRW